jgi:hypothetical protein
MKDKMDEYSDDETTVAQSSTTPPPPTPTPSTREEVSISSLSLIPKRTASSANPAADTMYDWASLKIKDAAYLENKEFMSQASPMPLRRLTMIEGNSWIDPREILTNACYRRGEYKAVYKTVVDWLVKKFSVNTPSPPTTTTTTETFEKKIRDKWMSNLRVEEKNVVYEMLGTDQPILYFLVSNDLPHQPPEEQREQTLSENSFKARWQLPLTAAYSYASVANSYTQQDKIFSWVKIDFRRLPNPNFHTNPPITLDVTSNVYDKVIADQNEKMTKRKEAEKREKLMESTTKEKDDNAKKTTEPGLKQQLSPTQPTSTTTAKGIERNKNSQTAPEKSSDKPKTQGTPATADNKKKRKSPSLSLKSSNTDEALLQPSESQPDGANKVEGNGDSTAGSEDGEKEEKSLGKHSKKRRVNSTGGTNSSAVPQTPDATRSGTERVGKDTREKERKALSKIILESIEIDKTLGSDTVQQSYQAIMESQRQLSSCTSPEAMTVFFYPESSPGLKKMITTSTTTTATNTTLTNNNNNNNNTLEGKKGKALNMLLAWVRLIVFSLNAKVKKNSLGEFESSNPFAGGLGREELELSLLRPVKMEDEKVDNKDQGVVPKKTDDPEAKEKKIQRAIVELNNRRESILRTDNLAAVTGTTKKHPTQTRLSSVELILPKRDIAAEFFPLAYLDALEEIATNNALPSFQYLQKCLQKIRNNDENNNNWGISDRGITFNYQPLTVDFHTRMIKHPNTKTFLKILLEKNFNTQWGIINSVEIKMEDSGMDGDGEQIPQITITKSTPTYPDTTITTTTTTTTTAKTTTTEKMQKMQPLFTSFLKGGSPNHKGDVVIVSESKRAKDLAVLITRAVNFPNQVVSIVIPEILEAQYQEYKRKLAVLPREGAVSFLTYFFLGRCHEQDTGKKCEIKGGERTEISTQTGFAILLESIVKMFYCNMMVLKML